MTLTDSSQTTTLLIGSAIVTWFAFHTLGGWQPLHDAVGPQMFSVLRPTGDFSGMPWHAVVLGYPVIGICILIMIVASLLDKDINTEENLKLVWGCANGEILAQDSNSTRYLKDEWIETLRTGE